MQRLPSRLKSSGNYDALVSVIPGCQQKFQSACLVFVQGLPGSTDAFSGDAGSRFQ